MNPVRSIKGLLLASGAFFAIAIFAATIFVVSRIYDRSVRDDAASDAIAFAELTFNSMFELMSTGWSRQQLEGFLRAIQKSVDSTQRQIDIYRGPKVNALFGEIAQKTPDAAIQRAFREGGQQHLEDGDLIRVVYPLRAQEVCLQCHVNATPGDVLGVIDVQQNVGLAVESHQMRFTYAFAPIIPVVLVVTFLMVLYIRRRLEGPIDTLARDIRAVNRISDLRRLEARQADLGFSEFNVVASEVRQLTERIRAIAVDKDMLEFEIRLLEKFVLTTEVIKDWREYVSRLIIDIDSVVPAYLMFSVFKVSDEAYDLEVFWRGRPSEATRQVFEKSLQQILKREEHFESGLAIRVRHNVADPATPTPELSTPDIDVQIKSLLVNVPKIGGIVGIGMQPQYEIDPMRLLVVQSILATLLNVVGSVKAIDKYTKELEYYATRDPLTNLYNQRVFWELIENEAARSSRHGQKFTLLVIDADNFKSINDSYGHGVGDSLLQLLVGGIKGAIRDDDLLSRYGGDEFVAILPETGMESAATVARRIVESVGAVTMTAPDGAVVSGSVSIGMATYPDHAVAIKDLFLFADNMMYRAKTEGKNRVAVPDEQDVIDVFRTLGEKSMLILNAVEKRSVVPFFQPIINVATGQVEAIEVLSRIRMDDGSYIIADEYVAIAEKMGVMHKLDFIQLEMTLEAVEQFNYKGFLFINMSPRALVLNDFVQETRRIASRYRIDPTRLVFEITERETIKNMALLERFIATLHGEGFKLAIDDFGSGFSSFHYVKRFPIDFLKIEGEFILGMKHSEKDRALVRSIVTLSRDLGIRTVAEYVEDKAVLDQVVLQGIDLAQGFHIHRPNISMAEAMKGYQG
ncbi:MAG: bifunctional diguanylate cyclase/phosphodiesterase [Rhodocyclales bacterium]|nr:bifunctional diguanylate cyclase/phosphodiesterase [Rhodocyclales bacterium]